ncbi:MAG: arginine repressor [Clostridia bacterium]|jgi:transcriptional regulator of arginine metabolism|nr:arginine repressor [Clostridia bacterium]
MKNKRQQAIIDIIREKEIRKQDELISELRARGFDVAQATVSRDLRELGVIKKTKSGEQKYLVSEKPEGWDGINYSPALAGLIHGTDCAGNIVVLKTASGMAGAVAVGIDRMNTRDILGCVAGDDTIIIVLRSPESASEFCEFFRKMCEKAGSFRDSR